MSPLRWHVSHHAVERYCARIDPRMRATVAREVLARLPESRAVVLVGTTDDAEIYREKRRPARVEYVVRPTLDHRGHPVRVLVTVLDPAEQPLTRAREICLTGE